MAMVSELGGDSFLASYYVPLFEEYRLFGVAAGNEKGYLEENLLLEPLESRISCGLQEITGGILSFETSRVELQEYETLLTGNGAEFLSQVRQQVELDGLTLGLSELFSKEMFTEAGTVGTVYRAQEEAQTATANVTKELLKLMEQVDGIEMGDHGFALDNNGRLQVADSFVKQLASADSEEWEKRFDNEEVYRTISGGFYHAEEEAMQIKKQVQKALDYEWDVEWLEDLIEDYEENLAALTDALEEEERKLAMEETPDTVFLEQLERQIAAMELAIENADREKDAYETKKDRVINEVRKDYKRLQKTLNGVETVLRNSQKTLNRLEEKQRTARIAVAAYESFLEGTLSLLSEELQQVFLQELETMKLYTGMEEQGYSVADMRQTIQTDLELLEGFSLEGCSEQQLACVETEMQAIMDGMQQYTVEYLWFTYGDIVVAEATGKNVLGAVGELLTTGILSLVGVSEQEQSDRSLDGKALPSEGMEKETMLAELLTCIDKVEELMQGQTIADALSAAGNAALDATALELYSTKYFHSYSEDAPYTRLNYEREYLVFGGEKDKTNLLYMVLHLVAIRTLFSMATLLKQPQKTAQLEIVAAGVSGFTGMPALGAAVKYSLLLLWSVEEALIEVAALLQGKRIPVIGTGTVSFGELFLMNKARIAEKARSLPDGAGAAYKEYLTLLSLTRPTKLKAYRALDLIQENIRYRYEDSFRIRTVVTKLSFCTKAKLKPLFDTGIFMPAAYNMEWLEESSY